MPAKQIDALAAYIPTPVALATYKRALTAEQPVPPVQVYGTHSAAAVLFADISGFTALTEKLTAHNPSGSEELTALLNLYLTRMIALLKRYGGQVVKFSGDALTALFPADDHDDAAMRVATLRAVYAAEAMQTATMHFQHLRSSIGEIALAVKVTIGVGHVFAANVGGVFDRWEYVIAGDPLTQVADAERHTLPGEVTLSAQAAALLTQSSLQNTTLMVWDERQRYAADLPSPDALLVSQAPLDWENLPKATLPRVAATLRSYVPAAITARLAMGQDAWLAELRRMTIMFIGVGGIDYDRDDALERLQALVAAAQRTIYRYEGSLNKLSVDDKGTVLLALFGAPPLAHEDDPQRALACARELQTIVAQGIGSSRATTPPEPIRMAIGITTDTVFAGPVGSPSRREYTVIGDAVNLAVRLMQVAGARNILCDERTYTLAQRRWRLEALPPINLKGKTQPVKGYRLLEPRSSGPTMTDKPIVNRERELTILRGFLDRVEQGSSCVVSIIGEGGIGKTRLAQEVIHLATQRDIHSLQGAASSTGQQTPYLVWREALSNYFELEGVRGIAQRAEQVRQRVRAIDPELEIRLPLLNDVLDLHLDDTIATRGLSPRQRRDSLAFFIVELLLVWAHQGGLLLVLEDMHFADSLSWELALDVARSLTLSPIVLLLVYRPLHSDWLLRTPTSPQPDLMRDYSQLDGYEDPSTARGDTLQHTLTRLRQYHELPLTALPRADVARLAANHLDAAVTPELADWLTVRSQGNPFFVEETLKMLREDDTLRLNANGKWHFANIHHLRTIPPSLKGVIQARLDRLDPSVQLTCKIASVVGRVFPARVVAGIYPIVEKRVNPQQHLETLAELDITPLDSPDPELTYRFKNTLTQEVAYANLLLAQRQALHQAVAAWYEHEYAADLEAYVPLIADHYQHTEQWHKRLHYAERAGRLAAIRYAMTEAITYFSQAIEVLREHPSLLPPPERHERMVELLLCRAEAYEQNCTYAQQERDLHLLSQLVETASNVKHQVWVRARWSRYYQLVNDHLSAERAATLALNRAEMLNDRQLIGESLNLLARTAELRADYRQALWWGAQALSNCRLAADRLEEANSLSFIGSGYAAMGDYDKASDYHQRALAIRQEIEDQRGEAASLEHIGTVQHNLGHPKVALNAYQRALEIRQRIGDRSGEAASLLHIGSAYQTLGDLSIAQSYQYQALQIWKVQGDQYGEAQLLVKMSSSATILGDFDTARIHASEAIDLAQTVDNRQIEGYGLDALGNANRGMGAFRAAYEQHKAAYALATSLGLRRLAAYARHHLGACEWEYEHAAAAMEHWAVAATIREEIGEGEFARASRTRQARALVALGELAEARTLVDQVWQVWGVNPPPGENEDELREAYFALYETWLHLEEYDNAIAALAWAHQAVQDRAVRISDAKMRQSFLDQVAINRAIISAWNMLSSDEGCLMKTA